MGAIRQFLRACAWLVAWVLLLVAVLAIAFALSRDWGVYRELIVFGAAWCLIAILSMVLLSRRRRPRARWLLTGFVLLAVSLGAAGALSVPAERPNDTDKWRAPSFEQEPWLQEIRDSRPRFVTRRSRLFRICALRAHRLAARPDAASTAA